VILNEISTVQALDTALLAYLGRQNAVEVRDVALNMVRKAAWDMFAEGWITEHYLAMAAAGACDHAPGKAQRTPTIG
jgi:hypothetical protein